MKTNFTLAVIAMIAGGAWAQSPAPPPPAPAAPAPAVSAPVAVEKPAPAAPVKTKAPVAPEAAVLPPPVQPIEPVIPLVPGPATVNASNVNVRGQAKLNSERVALITKGDVVTVLEEIVLDKPAPGEPARWARIILPDETKVWVHTLFIEAANKTVIPPRLNLRSGPGEEYSVVGLIERGEVVHETGAVDGNWMQIEAPKDAYAFVASQFLKQEAPAPVAAVVPSAPAVPPPAPTPAPPPLPPAAPPTPAPVSEPPPLAPPVTAPEPPAKPVVETPVAPVVEEPVPTPPEVPEEPLPPRIVSHEGVVRNTWSIQAPTKYALVDPDSGWTVNYLYTTSTNLDLSRYKGLRIVVTGEEGLDPRWKNTPVLTIQRIQVVE